MSKLLRTVKINFVLYSFVREEFSSLFENLLSIVSIIQFLKYATSAYIPYEFGIAHPLPVDTIPVLYHLPVAKI